MDDPAGVDFEYDEKVRPWPRWDSSCTLTSDLDDVNNPGQEYASSARSDSRTLCGDTSPYRTESPIVASPPSQVVHELTEAYPVANIGVLTPDVDRLGFGHLRLPALRSSVVCGVCGETFWRNTDMSKHCLRHTTPLMCRHPQCTELATFATAEDLYHHLKYTHSYICPEISCEGQELYLSIDSYKDHLLREHEMNDMDVEESVQGVLALLDSVASYNATLVQSVSEEGNWNYLTKSPNETDKNGFAAQQMNASAAFMLKDEFNHLEWPVPLPSLKDHLSELFPSQPSLCISRYDDCRHVKEASPIYHQLREKPNGDITAHVHTYRCTFPRCQTRFSSIADWKEHENTKHYRPRVWRCNSQYAAPFGRRISTLQHKCGRIYLTRDCFLDHLRKTHHIELLHFSNQKLVECHVVADVDRWFWCGYCQKLVHVNSEGADSWSKRLLHIEEHLVSTLGRPPRRMEDWVPFDRRLLEGLTR